MVQDRAIFTMAVIGQPIESRIWSIERRHFQWPWTTPNLVFKVMPFFVWHWLSHRRLQIRP